MPRMKKQAQKTTVARKTAKRTNRKQPAIKEQTPLSAVALSSLLKDFDRRRHEARDTYLAAKDSVVFESYACNDSDAPPRLQYTNPFDIQTSEAQYLLDLCKLQEEFNTFQATHQVWSHNSVFALKQAFAEDKVNIERVISNKLGKHR